MRILVFYLVASSSLLSGCSSLPHKFYPTPQVPLPARFEYESAHTSSMDKSAWWRTFGDSQLDAWVELALERNSDLAAAGIRVRRSALEVQLVNNARLPIPNGSVSTGISRPLSKSTQTTSEAASGTLGVSWELDLFDRISSQHNGAIFEAQASKEDCEAVALSLIGTTANLYWQIGFANERLRFAQKSLDYARRRRDLVDAQYRYGAVSKLEQREAEHTLAQQEAFISQFTRARNDLRQILTVLFDGVKPPGIEPQQLPIGPLPLISAGLPAELLGRRPDLRAAQMRLQASLANSDATAARYYPALSLTSSLGTSSSSLLAVLANPVTALGANLTLPFLNAREMRLNTEVAVTLHEEAVLGFRKSLYTALTEVERALSARIQITQQIVTQQRIVDEAIEIESLYRIRYQTGQVPLRAWLDAEEHRRTAQLTYTSVHLTQLQNYISLHQVLGGGVRK